MFAKEKTFQRMKKVVTKGRDKSHWFRPEVSAAPAELQNTSDMLAPTEEQPSYRE